MSVTSLLLTVLCASHNQSTASPSYITLPPLPLSLPMSSRLRLMSAKCSRQCSQEKNVAMNRDTILRASLLPKVTRCCVLSEGAAAVKEEATVCVCFLSPSSRGCRVRRVRV